MAREGRPVVTETLQAIREGWLLRFSYLAMRAHPASANHRSVSEFLPADNERDTPSTTNG